MKLKSLLFSMSVMATAPVFAATYYVTPEGAGTKDGSSWDNAFDVEAFSAQAAINANGDVYNFAGGVYKPSGTVVFKVASGAILIGNADGERTIFSGDKNGNNNPESGDLNRLIRFQTNTKNGDSTNKVVINNIDFTCVYTDTNSDSETMGALMIDNSGDIEVNSCNFYSNWANGTQGGAAAHLYRSSVKFNNCVFRNNSANYRGGAVRLRSNDTNKGVTTFENCVFKNNTNYHNLGGAIFMVHGKELNIINCTMFGNKAASDGAAIYANGKDASHIRKINIVNSTIAGNSISGDNKGGQIASTLTANIAIANSIVASKAKNTADFYFSGTGTPAVSFVSGGYNFVGEIIGAPAEIAWLDSDNHGDDCTYTAIFGDNTLNSDNVIIPTNFYLGATAKQVSDAVASWGLPANLNLAVDQLGTTRGEDVTPGAYAYAKPGNSTGIEDIAGDAQAARLISLGANLYQIEGYEGAVNVYNISGLNVMTTNDSSIDLNSMAAGLYIIKAGNTIFKVTK